MKIYLIILAIQFLGISWHLGEKLMEFDKQLPDDSLWDVFKMIWKSDKISILISFLLIPASTELLYYVVINYAPDNLTKTDYFTLGFFGLALVFGYSGQKKIYGILGKMSDVVDKKIAAKLDV